MVGAIAFGYLGISSWNAVQKMPEKPLFTSLDQIVNLTNTDEDLWVEIEKVNWDCQNIVYSNVGSDVRTEVIFTEETTSILGIALFSKSKGLSCSELSETNVIGILSKMTEGFYNRMFERGFNLANYKDAEVRLHLCTFCGRSNSYGLVIVSVIFVPLGLAMYPLCLRMRKKYENGVLL